ncbi:MULTISPECIES: hypothetical protein [unclassified Crossiella]|uniref:hypothetical protein n=1 Tax=unclassified Crossiella TaxID=2620835 RepID=UPI001FFF8832|nr:MULTISPECIES: hypothetical protein [unclassified Crossiella]MCK2245281.1 hypothetical protein [Crossiella sp. S99.2]MCK2258933.1 hypothetical protein [Crossiella sp. S99.1]
MPTDPIPALPADGDTIAVRGVNPYPGADTKSWTARLAHALAEETGWPLTIAADIAPFVTRPKDHLVLGKNGAPDRLKPSLWSTTDYGECILTLRMHGFAGNAGEYNERIRSAFSAPVHPQVDPARVLPCLVTGRTLSGALAPFITTAEAVPHERVMRLVGAMKAALKDANGDRNYDLAQDLALHGQQQPTTHVPLLRKIQEPTPSGGVRMRELVELTATKGANRTMGRLELFGLTPADMIFGVRPNTVFAGEPTSQSTEIPIVDPQHWVPVFADLLRQAFADPDHSGHSMAVHAAKVATVEMHIVAGARDLTGADVLDEDFHGMVFDSNRVDHRRPPLEYSLLNKSASDLRALLRDYKTHGLITEQVRAWLAGEGPDPDPRPRESTVDARDRRDHALFDAVFPPQPSERDQRALRARTVLGEPAPSQTQGKHVQNRLRMFSAGASDGYSYRWNPRLLDGALGAGALKPKAIRPVLPTWREVKDAAQRKDFSLLDGFLLIHGTHWLAEAKLIEADRGSIAAQAADPDSEEAGRLQRRSVTNLRTALLQNPQAAYGLLCELAHATETRTAPRQVGEDGRPIDGAPATRAWINTVFPKVNGRATRARTVVTAGGTIIPAAQPTPDPGILRVLAQSRFQDTVTRDMIDAFVRAFQRAEDLVRTAAEAEARPLADNTADAVDSLEGALLAVVADGKKLIELLPSLKRGEATPADFQESRSAQFAVEVAE